MPGVEQGRCLGEGEPWLHLVMFGHTLLPFTNDSFDSIRMICSKNNNNKRTKVRQRKHNKNGDNRGGRWSHIGINST